MPEPTPMSVSDDVYLSPYEPKVTLEPAQQTTVYKDPYFGTDPEATVTLVKKIAQNDQRELWRVTLPTGENVIRWIKKQIAVA